MRRTIIIILGIAFIVMSGCGGDSGKKISKKDARIEFKENTHNFGELAFGSDGECEFPFKNTGKAPLVLTNVKSTCGCTIPEWPREPIKVNESASIKVRYDTHRIGSFTKSITVYSNASNSPKRLFIKGRVTADTID